LVDEVFSRRVEPILSGFETIAEIGRRQLARIEVGREDARKRLAVTGGAGPILSLIGHKHFAFLCDYEAVKQVVIVAA
jgi:hypothetical protein